MFENRTVESREVTAVGIEREMRRMRNGEFIEDSSRTRSLLPPEFFSLEQLMTPL